MSKHTKGKWEVANSGGKVYANDRTCVCTLREMPLNITPEVEANARLIAAAPDMLEMCKKFLPTFKILHEQECDKNCEPNNCWICAGIKEIEAVIAKAETV